MSEVRLKLVGMVSFSAVSKVASHPEPMLLQAVEAAARVAGVVIKAKQPKEVDDKSKAVYPVEQLNAVGLTVGTELGITVGVTDGDKDGTIDGNRVG